MVFMILGSYSIISYHICTYRIYTSYNIIHDAYISPLPGLHSGRDSFRFKTITIVQLTIHCRQHSIAQSVPFYCGLLPNTAPCSQGTAVHSLLCRLCSPGFEFGSKSFTNLLPTHCRPTAVASTRRDVGFGCFT
jgi:hypothetical protein